MIAPDPNPQAQGETTLPIIPFTGVFDGDGHTIKNLKVMGGRRVGLFGRLGSAGSILNVGLEAAAVRGTVYVGGLVGDSDGRISASYSSGSVSGDGNVGGLVGANWNRGIISSYSAGSVNGNGSVGGLVGHNIVLGSIATSYSTCSVRGKDRVGGLVGENDGCIVTSFWDIQTSGQSGSAGGAGLNTAEMMNPYMLGLNGLANDPNWVLEAGRDYPRLAWQGTRGNIIPEADVDWLTGHGTADSPYRIDTADQLILVNKASILWDRHFILGADIDLDPALPGGRIFGQAVIPAFAGVFDGGGHTISNLTIEGTQHLGLFGYLTDEAEVRNTGIIDVNVTGSGYRVGGLAGKNKGNIFDSYSSGWINGTQLVGGLVGSHWRGTIAGSHSSSSVRGTSDVGGLAGESASSITASYSSGSVSGTGYRIGGLVGWNSSGHIVMSYSAGAVDGNGSVGGLVGSTGGSGEITSSYSSTSVRGTDAVGGLAGSHVGSIVTSYSSGSVTGIQRVGGLVGSNWRGDIVRSYSSGSVSGTDGVGGLVGSDDWNTEGSTYWNTVHWSFWDTQASGQRKSDGGNGKTTVEMRTTSTFLMAGWDFRGETVNGTEDVWWIDEGRDYPRLWWEATGE